jgi:hypothetical protein
MYVCIITQVGSSPLFFSFILSYGTFMYICIVAQFISSLLFFFFLSDGGFSWFQNSMFILVYRINQIHLLNFLLLPSLSITDLPLA